MATSCAGWVGYTDSFIYFTAGNMRKQLLLLGLSEPRQRSAAFVDHALVGFAGVSVGVADAPELLRADAMELSLSSEVDNCRNFAPLGLSPP